MYPCLEVVLFVTKSFQMKSVCVHSLKLYQSSNCSLKDIPSLVSRDAWKVGIRELATLRKIRLICMLVCHEAVLCVLVKLRI